MMQESIQSSLSIREACEADIGFIMSSWKRSWRVSPWAGCIRNDEYYASISSTIEGLVARGAYFLVAVPSGGPNVSRILGWACAEVLGDGTCAIHYVYVKDPYLRLGIGDKLVNAAKGTKPGLYTFRFHQVAEACSFAEGWRHSPEVARRK
jgi:GNAT superfamily N-acetyltransferase